MHEFEPSPTGENADHPPAAGLPVQVPDFVEQELGETIDNTVPTRGYDATPMVGLGGSAGSIQALISFFKAMPTDSGMTFIVVLHLSPTHHSTLPELLGRATTMPVAQVEDGIKAKPNRVYVIPPGKHLAAVDGYLRLTDLESERGKRVAVDLFFRSLADTHGPHALAIILSGADGDGAIGIKRIKERGGLTVAQDPNEAEHDSMPRTAIDTGMVDWVLEVAQMPHRLVEYLRNETQMRLPPEDGPRLVPSARPPADEDEAALRDVLVFLRSRTGREFSYYKRATVLRRISRRMQVNSLDTMAGYLSFLRTHPGESGALLQDLLISVTNFFRDRDAFTALEAQIPVLFDQKGPSDSVRVWVPACATGEEAYSIAMLLLEHARRLPAPPSLQVFACDLDAAAIADARAGLYQTAITADVSEERLAQFFVKETRGYRVRREVRECVLFAVHDLLKDAPFSRVDLVSCRNLLIYLNRDAQERAVETFHFALRPGGYLFLGTSESVEDGHDLFNVLDKKHRLYAPKTSTQLGGLPVPTGAASLTRLLEAQEQNAANAPTVPGRGFANGLPGLGQGDLRTRADRASLAELHFRLIERVSPPSLIVNADQEIIHLSEHAGRFLQFIGGEPTANLMRAILPELRVELRSAMFRAIETNARVEVVGAAAEVDGDRCLVDLTVSPAPELGLGYLLVVFTVRAPQDGDGEQPAEMRAPLAAAAEPVVRQFERELESVRGQLRDTVEQYEASTEEMKASNEELQAMNEELRSASEELETSREELQSINEELTTVNLEMRSKMDEVAHANSDLQNLMASTSIATIFLDRQLNITRYTPSAADIFYLIPADVGRPLEHVKLRVDYPDLVADAEKVLRNLLSVEREVAGGTRWFLVRLQPYRTVDDRIGGVVLTFVDVTERTVAEQELGTLKDQLTSDLAGMTSLYELNQRVLAAKTLPEILQEILAVATGFVHAAKGNVQLLTGQGQELETVVQQGHGETFLKHALRAHGDAVCKAALRAGERVVIGDVTTSPLLVGTADLERLLADGIRSGQATPLVNRRGQTLGVLTTYHAETGFGTEDQFRRLDLLTWLATDAIDRWHVDEALRTHVEELTRFNAAAVGRETRMIELKRTVNVLSERLGEAPPHALAFEEEGGGRVKDE